LDDRPVFEDDRRRAEAFIRGGIQAERDEAKKIRKEKDDKHWANHEAFHEMIKDARKRKTDADQVVNEVDEAAKNKETKK
jgi:dynein assembly factor 1